MTEMSVQSTAQEGKQDRILRVESGRPGVNVRKLLWPQHMRPLELAVLRVLIVGYPLATPLERRSMTQANDNELLVDFHLMPGIL